MVQQIVRQGRLRRRQRLHQAHHAEQPDRRRRSSPAASCEVNFARFIPKLGACLEAAHRAGDLRASPAPHATCASGWCTTWPCMASNMFLPEPARGRPRRRHDTLVEEMALFALRGLGLTEAAIDAALRCPSRWPPPPAACWRRPANALPAPARRRSAGRREKENRTMTHLTRTHSTLVLTLAAGARRRAARPPPTTTAAARAGDRAARPTRPTRASSARRPR